MNVLIAYASLEIRRSTGISAAEEASFVHDHFATSTSLATLAKCCDLADVPVERYRPRFNMYEADQMSPRIILDGLPYWVTSRDRFERREKIMTVILRSVVRPEYHAVTLRQGGEVYGCKDVWQLV